MSESSQASIFFDEVLLIPLDDGKRVLRCVESRHFILYTQLLTLYFSNYSLIR